MILACIDNSRFAASVCDHAAWAASELGLPVELLHVLERPRMDPVIGKNRSGHLGIDTREHLLEQIVELDEQRNRLAQQSGRLLLDEAANRIRDRGITDVRQRLAHGELVDQVHEYGHDATMVVIGKEGEGAGARHLGANLARLIRSSERPVLVATDAFQPIERYMLAFDGGSSTGRAIDFLIRTSLLATTEGHILNVNDGGTTMQDRLNDAASRLEASGFQVTAIQRSGDPDDVIPQAVDELKADLLVMGAYGHSRIRDFFVGSTTSALLRSTTVPLLVMR